MFGGQVGRKKDQAASQGEEGSAEARRRRRCPPLPRPAVSVLLDVPQRPEALQQGRVGVVPHGEEPVRHREAQVVHVELDEGRVQLWGFAHVTSEGVRLELKPAAQNRQTERQQLQNRAGEGGLIDSHLTAD